MSQTTSQSEQRRSQRAGRHTEADQDEQQAKSRTTDQTDGENDENQLQDTDGNDEGDQDQENADQERQRADQERQNRQSRRAQSQSREMQRAHPQRPEARRRLSGDAVFDARAAIRVGLLRLARDWQDTGSVYQAIHAYTEVLARYPGTGVASAATEELVALAGTLQEEGRFYAALNIFNILEQLV